MLGDAPLVDAKGDPVKESALIKMISEFAASRHATYEEARSYLCASTDEQAFVLEFTSLMNNKAQAWIPQEQEMVFTEDSGDWNDGTSITDMLKEHKDL